MASTDIGPFPQPETVEEKTLHQYLAHAKSVRNACKKDLGGKPDIATVVRWFVVRDHEFAAPTIRGYRAGLRYKMKCDLASGILDAKRHEAVLQKLATGPLPKPKGQKKQTSSRKKKAVNDDLIAQLIEELHAGGGKDGLDEFLIEYVKFSLTFFPRPSEWAGASIIHVTDPETGAVIMRRLRLPNSKRSNGRSFGPTRELDISNNIRFVRDLMHFLRLFQIWIGVKKSPVKLQNAIRNRLAYVTEAAGLPRISPYSFRHAGMAAAKEEMDQLQVSYAAGHGSDRTKIDNYARSRPSTGGWVSPSEAFAVPADRAAIVRVTGRVTRNRRVAYLEAKTELKRPQP